jgi:hypothetical protein
MQRMSLLALWYGACFIQRFVAQASVLDVNGCGKHAMPFAFSVRRRLRRL